MDLKEYTDEAVKEFRKQVKEEFDRIGAEAVDIAKASTAYKDRTGHLRASNGYEATEEELRLFNKADYASYVEAKTGNVIADAVLFIQRKVTE